MTFLILFVSTLGLISVTYYFAVEKVNTRSQTLKISTAKQDLLSLDQNLVSVVSQPGSARTFEVADSDGKLNVQPFNNSLTITVNDGREINEVVFNETIGQIYYELPFSESPETGLFLKGDSRTVVNQSGSVITQLCIVNGAAHPEIMLHYRPAASCSAAGLEDNRTINNLRLYVVNLNASEPIAQYGRVPLKISCESTQMITRTYELSYSPETLLLTSVLDGDSGQVSIPISSTDSGAIINLEIVQCNIKVERSVM
jgi:hypothetical protein